MIRAIIGFAALHLVVCAVGLAVLHALKLTRPGSLLIGSLLALPIALLVGIVSMVPIAIVLLVLGVPLTLITFGVVAAVTGTAALVVAQRRAAGRDLAAGLGWRRLSRLGRIAVVVVAVVALAYLLGGVYAFSRVSTVWDDARIWSLRGLTLTYYHSLVPTIFTVQSQSGGHPVYPLLQPAFEAVLFQAMGSPELRWLHSELWLWFCTGVWSAGYLILRPWRPRSPGRPYWVTVLALVALTPAALLNVDQGYADVSGAMLLGLGVLAFGGWLADAADDSGDTRHPDSRAVLGGLFLIGAANTKDEDLLGALIVLVLVVIFSALRSARPGDRRDWRVLALVISGFVVLVAPWRIWTAAHHLTEAVEPKLPQALSPVYVAHHATRLHRTASSMLTQVTHEWGFVLVIFVLVSAVSLYRGRRAVTLFYLVTFVVIAAALVWLYTTTTLNLGFLLSTSMYRTVDVFMIFAGFVGAEQVAALTRGSAEVRDGSTAASVERAPESGASRASRAG